MADLWTYERFRRECPQVPYHLLRLWCKRCVHIGRPVHSEPKDAPLSERLIAIDDVREALRRYRDDLPDTFTNDEGEELVSRAKLRADGYHGNIYETTGADGNPLTTKVYYQLGHGHHHQAYVRKVDADFLLNTESELPADVKLVDIQQAAALGFYRDFLARHSRSESNIRKTTPRPHPALDGVTDDGLIRTETKRVWQDYKDRWSGEQRRRRTLRVRWVLSDLMQIKNAKPPSSDIWILGFEIAKPSKPYGLTKKQLQLGVRSGRIEAVEFAVNEHYPKLLPEEGASLPAFRLYYRKADVLAEAKRVLVAKARPKPKPFARDRVWRDPVDGRLFRRQPEAMHKAGVSASTLTSARAPHGHCKYLPGNRAIEAKQIPNDLFGAGRSPQVWVYFDGDLTAIWKAKHGAKRPRRSVPTGKARGREATTDAERDADFYARYKASGLKMPAFALSESVPIEEAKRRAGRARFRKSKAQRA